MPKTIDELSSAVMNALYSTIKKSLGDTDDDSVADDPFVAWCRPGIPFEADDFRFARFMLQGQGASDTERQADAILQLTQAAGFSRFVDFVPSVSGLVDTENQGGVMRPGSATLSEFYKRILGSADVAELPNAENVDAKIVELEGKAEPLFEKYRTYRKSYNDANRAYVAARIRSTWSPADALTFQSDGPVLKSERDDAFAVWKTLGKKDQFDDIQAQLISLRNKRSPAIWLAEALARFNDMPEGQNAVFGEARFTLPYPGSFASSDSGWTSFNFETSNIDKLDQTTHRKWDVGGGFGWGSLKLGGSGSGTTDTELHVNNTEGFGIKMSVAQIPLLRHWFDPWFMRSPFWRFKPGSIEAVNGDVVSDGASPPKGLMVGYPVSAIFIRDIEIKLAELNDTTSELYKAVTAEGGGGWGFGVVNARGKYERNSTTNTQKVSTANGTLSIEGLQLAGFLCEQFDMCPNPRTDLAWVAGP